MVVMRISGIFVKHIKCHTGCHKHYRSVFSCCYYIIHISSIYFAKVGNRDRHSLLQQTLIRPFWGWLGSMLGHVLQEPSIGINHLVWPGSIILRIRLPFHVPTIPQVLSDQPCLLSVTIQLAHFSKELPCLVRNFLSTAAPSPSPLPPRCTLLLAFLYRNLSPVSLVSCKTPLLWSLYLSRQPWVTSPLPS